MPADISRRRFLRQASAGTAAVGVIAVGGRETFGLKAHTTAEKPAATATPSDSAESLPDGPVIAQILNAQTGEISVLVGTREVIYTNREVAQELLRVTR